MTAMHRIRYLLVALLLASTATISANSRLEFSLLDAGSQPLGCSVTDALHQDSGRSAIRLQRSVLLPQIPPSSQARYTITPMSRD
jgi:hypothetical protein